MPATALTDAPVLTDQQVNDALLALPPLHDNVLVVVRDLQAQITALTARVATLEAAS